MSYHFVKKLKDKSGIAIMSVMLYFMVMMIFVGGLTITSQGNMNVSNTSSEMTAAYYAAEAGINYVVSDFKRILNVDDGDMTQTQFFNTLNAFVSNHVNTRLDLSPNNGKESYALISFINPVFNESNQTFSFTVRSIGYVNDKSRTLETFVDLDYSLGAGNRQGFAVKHAVLVKNTFITQNIFTIEVSPNTLLANPTAVPWVATTSTARNSLTFGNINKTNDSYTGLVELLPKTNNNVTNVPSSRISDTLILNEFTQLDFNPVREQAQLVLERINNKLPTIVGFTSGDNINPSNAGTYSLPGGSYYVPSINFNSNNVTIHATSDVFIVTDRMYIEGNVSFTGPGEVKFYVRRNMTTSNTFTVLSTLNNRHTVGRIDKPHLFIVYVDETNPIMTVVPENNHIIYGSFMFNNANLNFSNNVSFGGYLMTGGASVSLQNGSDVFTALYYAPNANVSIGNSTIRGAVIAKDVTLANNGTIQYEPAFLTNFPFAVESPIVDTSRTDGVHSIMFRIHRTTEK